MRKYAYALVLHTAILSQVWSQTVFPGPVPQGELRIITWNIEFLGNRTPERTKSQIEALALRIKSWDAAVIAVQEIASLQVLDNMLSLIGPAWKRAPNAASSTGGETCLLWDSKKVENKITTRWTKAGDKTHDSFRAPISGIFKPVNGDYFTVVSVHGHYADDNIRRTQGEFYREMVKELLKDTLSHDLLFMGDFNNTLGNYPHTTFQNTTMETLVINTLKENGTSTYIYGGDELDYIYSSVSVYDKRLKNKKSFVIRPSHYGESNTEFESTYSDHLPVFVHLKASISTGVFNVVTNSPKFEHIYPPFHFDFSSHIQLNDLRGRVVSGRTTGPSCYVGRLHNARGRLVKTVKTVK